MLHQLQDHDEDHDEVSRKEPWEPSIPQFMLMVAGVVGGTLILVATLMPFAIAWSKWIANQFGLDF